MIRVLAAAMAWAVAHRAYGLVIRERRPDQAGMDKLFNELQNAERALLRAVGALSRRKTT